MLKRKAGWLCVGLTAALLVGCSSGTKKRSTAEYRVQSIKKLIASLQSTFEKGKVEERLDHVLYLGLLCLAMADNRLLYRRWRIFKDRQTSMDRGQYCRSPGMA